MTAHVRGIENHEIASIHLVTTGGVSLTTSGEAIMIVHQNAHYGKTQDHPLISSN